MKVPNDIVFVEGNEEPDIMFKRCKFLEEIRNALKDGKIDEKEALETIIILYDSFSEIMNKSLKVYGNIDRYLVALKCMEYRDVKHYYRYGQKSYYKWTEYIGAKGGITKKDRELMRKRLISQ